MVMGWIKAASEGDFIPFLTKYPARLGAPYVANWNDWPVFGEEVVFGLGMVAKGIGLFPAANVGVLLGHLVTVLAFYFCCRLLRFRREWSFVAAVLFSFTYFHAYRSLHHLLLTYSHTVPMAIACAWLVGFSRRIRFGDWRSWFCFGTAALLGLSNPYNLNLFGQLLCLSLVVQFLTKRRKANLKTGFVCLAVAVVCFFAINLDTFSQRWSSGQNVGALQRAYYETELFALKPIELVVPPVSHRWATLANIGSRYLTEAWLKGEVFSPYLGVVGVAALIWMFWEGFALIARVKRVPRRFPAYAPQTLWVLFYSVVGGLNCMIALGGVPLFRGSNRYSIFISALVLFFLASRMSWWTRNWQPAKRLLLALGVLIVGLFDQLPQSTQPEETRAVAAYIQSDVAFGQNMEAKLAPKSMVFQLPIVPYPESTPVNGVQSYEHFRPYFHTKTLRFSFGSNKGRPREDWQKEVEKQPAPQMIAALERYGFAAIYINRKGFRDQGQDLIKQLAAAGRSQVIEDDLHEQVCVLLNPASKPELPPAEINVPMIMNRGWRRSVDSPGGMQHWTAGDAEISIVNPDKQYVSYTFTAQIGSLRPRHVSIEAGGKQLWSADLGGNQVAPINVTFEAKPGKCTLLLKTDVGTRPSKQDPMPMAFAVINPKIARTEAGRK